MKPEVRKELEEIIEDVVERVLERFFQNESLIPAWDEFKSHAEKNKSYTSLMQEDLQRKYNNWKDNNWKDGNNNKIKNWKLKLNNTIPYLKKSEEKLNKEVKATTIGITS